MSVKVIVDGSALDYKEDKFIAEVSGNSVGQCIESLVRQQASLDKVILGKDGKLALGNFIKINGQYLYSDALISPIKDGDQIEIVKFRGC
jgi:hypothetical protein